MAVQFKCVINKDGTYFVENTGECSTDTREKLSQFAARTGDVTSEENLRPDADKVHEFNSN